MSLRRVIQEKHNKRTHFTWNGIEVFIKDEIPNKEVSLTKALNAVEKKIPRHLMRNIDSIYMGDFDFLNGRDIQATYENSSIFVTNNQSSVSDMADDIVHEIAHSVEDVYQRELYEDGKLEKEFINKRSQLYSVLKSEGYPVSLHFFMEPSYNKDFDDYLYREVGYPVLNMISTSIFYSPYAATSLREYFANGFEAFFYFGDYDFIKKSCPRLFEKLTLLLESEDDNEYY
jgi:hypothetical protein